MDNADIGELFEEGIQYRIPLFQRHYVWKEAGQWDPLWGDIKKNIAKYEGNGGEKKISSHFTGAVVVQQRFNSPGRIVTYEVIDGQQRLTTFQVILCALRDSFKSPDAVREVEKFLLNSHSTNGSLGRYKLVPTKFDKTALSSLIDSRKSEAEVSGILLIQAYKYFMGRIDEFAGGDEDRLHSLLRCVCNDFQFVSIVLDNEDDPEMIFESLNGRGQPLLQFDLLRNNLFLRARQSGEKDRDNLYQEYWGHFEDGSWDKEVTVGKRPIVLSELFLQHFLNAKLAKEKVTPFFRVYRKEYSKEFMKNKGAEKELKELHDCSKAYLRIADPKEESDIAPAVKVYHDLDITSLRPFILYLLTEMNLSPAVQKHVFKALEAYTVRRLLCEFQSKDFNKFFPKLITELRDGGSSAKNFLNLLAEQESMTRKWPKNYEVKESLTRPIGGDRRRKFVRYVLYRIESFIRQNNKFSEDNNLISEQKLELEHILPQAWKGTWPLELSDGRCVKLDEIFTDEYRDANSDWATEMSREGLLNESYVEALECAKKRDRLLESFGNLTLLTKPLNARVSNNSFDQKKEELKHHTTLFLNKDVCNEDSWDVSQIEKRTEVLHKKFCEIWPDAKWFLDNIPPE